MYVLLYKTISAGRWGFGSLTTRKTDLKLYPVSPCSKTSTQTQANEQKENQTAARVHIITINSYPKSLLLELESKIKWWGFFVEEDMLKF